MELDTRHFGVIDIDEKGIIAFPEGIPGFENVKKFVLLGSTDESSVFQWLQGIDDTGVAFAVIDPKVLIPDYIVDVDDSQVEILDINDTCKVLVMSIVVVPEDINNITANLKAPVLINTENNKGKQVVLEKNGYKTRHYIIQELRKNGGKK